MTFAALLISLIDRMTHKKDFLKKYGLPDTTSLSIEDISMLTGIPTEALQIVYNRGIGAHRAPGGGVSKSVRLHSGEKFFGNVPASARMGKERWAAARVYSFVMGGKTFKTTDSDVAEYYGLVKN